MVQTLYLGGTAFSNVTVGSTTVTAVYVGSTKIWEAGSSWTDPDIANASYDSKSLTVGGQETQLRGIALSSDGTQLYVVGSSSDAVFAYDLSTAWDVSSGSYSSNSFSVSTEDSTPSDIFFKPDGTKMYIIGYTSDRVHQYSLSTAWDITTASYDSKDALITTQEDTPHSLVFNSDGTSFYAAGNTADTIFQYDMTTAWDVSTASYANKSVSLTSIGNINGININPDDNQIYITSSSTDTVYVYNLSTAGDISTATDSGTSFSVASQSTAPQGVIFKTDGSKMYIADFTNSASCAVYQYSTVDPYASWTDPDIANASYDSVSLAVGGVDTTPVSLSFNNDGTKFYFLGAQNKKVYQYSCSTAYDLSTATKDTEEASVSLQVTAARGFNFNNDGTKFFVSCYTNDAIYEYDLSTAFNVSTASYSNTSLSVTVGSNGSHCMSSDGLYIYIIDEADDVDSYELSTAWDLSTATVSGTKNDLVSTTETSPSGMFISPDGTKLFISGYSGDVVTQNTLSTAYDITTASYDSVSFSVASQDGVPYGLFFKPDGSKMYVAGLGNDSIYQYSTQE